jgi:uncharacterized repeat protein (TIGR04138 family)
MPPEKRTREKSLQEVVAEVGVYPMEAFEFVHQGLGYTVAKVRGNKPDENVSGQQLCQGLREFALLQWGLLARTVLKRWNITGTLDFGRIVFALVDNGLLRKTETDKLEDFRNVYDFATAFEVEYRIRQEK